MKFKSEIIIISLIIAMLFTVSSVCAVDGEIQAISAQNSTDTVLSTVNDDSLKMNDTDEILSRTDDGSFTALNAKITGAAARSTVYLENDYEYSSTDTITDGIRISKYELTIDGRNHIIDAKGSSRIFQVANSYVVIKNIIFKNAYADEGGAIKTFGDLTSIVNCTFIDNEAGSGGAIYTSAIWFGTVENCTFINNRASSQGAAIYKMTDGGAIDRCIFVNNSASNSIIYTYQAMTVRNSVFVNNDAKYIFMGSRPSVTANNNWWGSTVDDYQNLPSLGSGVTVNNYYVLNMTLGNQGAAITLNNLYENGVITSSYNNYALPSINFTVKAKNVSVGDNVILGKTGVATITYTPPADAYSVTIDYNGVELTRKAKASFKSLRDKINSEGNEINLDQDYIYDSVRDSGLTNGIDFAKDVTIDGHGHIIDAVKSSNIFYFNDDTNSCNLTLKNIIFANAAGDEGAAVYFKGNKIEITNCTFTNNKANSQGDAVYVANANSDSNRITQSTFKDNIGANSVLYINLDSTDARLELTNSILVGNDTAYNVKGTGNVIADYNWWGNTADDYQNLPSLGSGVTVNKYYVLNMTLGNQGATITLNNLYENGVITSSYNNYELPSINFTVKAKNISADDNVILATTGVATITYTPADAYSLTIGYCDVELTRVVKASFKSLRDKINSEGNEINLDQDYIYDSVRDSGLTNGIDFAKDVTIDGHGHIIDAVKSSNIFYFNDDTNSCNLTLKNIIFANAAGDEGAAVYFKGNKIEIINCTFTNNKANSQGDAVYVANANSDSNRITQSTFKDNIGANSVLYINLDSTDARLELTNSILVGNDAAYNVKGTGNVIADYNWWGNTAENYNEDSIAKIDGVTLDRWLFAKIDAEADKISEATLSLNNLYENGGNSTYADYELPTMTFTLGGSNVENTETAVTLDANGLSTYRFSMLSASASLTASHDDVTVTKTLEFVDDGSFRALNALVWFNTELELNRDYAYSDSDTMTEGIDISRKITINGNGHTIDGSNLARIFNITANEVTLKNIKFINGSAGHGGAIYNNIGSGFKLINCTFENNVAYNNSGGAIYTYSNGVNDFINCTFIGNKIAASSQKNGGAIYVYEVSGQNNFVGCTFINNAATGYGGAIATESGNAITNIDKSVFVTNSAASCSSIYITGGTSAEFYLKNSIIFSKGFTTDSSIQVGVNSSLAAGDVNYNWWGHAIDNYNQNDYVHFSGVDLSVTKYLFLNMTCEDEIATLSINNLYDSSTQTCTTYYGELPQITFDLSGVNAKIDGNATLNKNGVSETEFDITAQSGSITAAYNGVSITKSFVLDDSFTVLQHKINRASEGAELALYHDYNYDGTIDAGLTEGIVIDKDLTIDGQGFTLDAKDAARIFKIDDNSKNIVFKNIKFTNARAADGAAVYANCNNIEVINCTFEYNDATNNGDALYVIANGCDITKSAFVNNLGIQSALYLTSDLQDAPFNMDNSILVNNAATNIVKDDKINLTANYNWWGNTVDDTADLSGGLAQNWYLLDMTVDNTKSIATVSLNSLWDGSAYSPCETCALPTIVANIQTNAYASARKDKVIVDNDGDTVGYIATDESNAGKITVSYNGISLTREVSYNEESDYSFKALKKLIEQANDNEVITLTHDYEYVIGYDDITSGIDIVQMNLTINGNGYTIDAKGQTRIFNVGSYGYLDGSNLTIKNATFANGKISANGGAILWYGGDGNLANCTFVNNTVTGYSGGALSIQSENMKVFNATFRENNAASKGGAVYILSDNVVINQSRFVKNDGGSNGGAIYWDRCNYGTIIDSTFIGNHAISQGGALETDRNAGDITIINSTFSNNRATSTGKGGAIYWGSLKNINITNSTFSDNHASGQGGALYWYTTNGGSSGILYNSTFINNTAVNGGAIYISSGTLDIDESDFINNTAIGTSAANGGAIHSTANSLNINNTNFIGNAANAGSNAGLGGALYVPSSDGKLNIDNSNFIKNSAYSNSGTSRGGVMYVATNCNITNSAFISNSATVGGSGSAYGGVFYWEGAKGNISKSVFINNVAKYGGVIYGSQSDSSRMNVTNSIFINNKISSSNSVNVMNTVSDGFYNFTECWFGNTRHDGYSSKGLTTKVNYIDSNRPLCLELDSYDVLMIVGDDKEIKYHFKYSEGDDTYVYDSSKLPKINLTLSTVKADVDKNHAGVDETILFNANQYGNVSITAKFHDLEYNETLTAKLKVIITVDENPIVVHVGEHKELTGIYLDPATLSYTPSVEDGDEYIELDNQFNLVGLKEGESFLIITSDEDNIYAKTILKVPVSVIKYTTEFVTLIDSNPVDSIVVDWGAEPQNIQVVINSDDPNPDYTNLSFNFEIDNATVAKFSTNPSLITFGAAGTANITFSTLGNERYYGSEKNITVTVRKVESSITVSPVEVVYGSTNTSTLTVDGVTGVTATLYGGVDEIAGVVSVNGNVVTINAANLDVGTYTLSVTTVPDENHTSVTGTSNVVVNPAGSDVTVPMSSSVVYGSSVDVDVVIPNGGNASGISAKLYLGDVEVVGVVSVSGLKVTVNAETLNVGTYALKVTTVTDSNHVSVTKECSIVVNPAGSDVTVPASGSVNYKDSIDVVASGLVNASGITAKLYLGTDEMPNAVSVNDLTVTVDASDLNVGDYTLKVTTVTDDNHSSVTCECIVTVNKIDSEVTFLPDEINFAFEDEGLTIATCTGCTIEHANVAIENHPEAVIKVEGNNITVSNLTEGDYIMKVVTTPIDSNYNSIEISLNVKVSAISPKMSMHATNITVGEKETVFITMDTEAKGIVNITLLNGTEIIDSRNITINNRFNKTEFTCLKVGEYTITAFYYGALNYNEILLHDTFTVHPIYDFEFAADVNDTVCGNRTNATVTLSADASGSIQIGAIVKTIEGPVTVIELPVQNVAGKNNVTVKYIPDANSKYAGGEVTVFYTVAKKATEIIIAPIADVKAGDNVSVQATAYEGANIVVYVNGVETTQINDIAAGTYTVVATVAETDEYLPDAVVFTFEATKYVSAIKEVSVNPVIEGAASIIEVAMNGTESGFVIIEIDGVNYTANINGGNTSLGIVLDATVPGKVYYLGDDKFDAAEAKEFTAVVNDKADSIIAINEPAFVIGESATFTASVNGAAADLVYIINGVATDTIDKVEATIYTVTAIFEGNATHNANSTTKGFTVSKDASAIKEVSVDSVIEGAVSTICVVMNSTESGFVIIEIDGVNYTANINGGNASFGIVLDATVSGKVYYLGDDKFDAAEAKEFTAVVNDKADSIIAINEPTFVIGESATFNATVNGAAADLVYIINGVATDTIDKVEAMNYSVMVIFEGNATHKLNGTTKSFIVSKYASAIKEVSVDSVIEGAASIIEVAMNGAESGFVIIEIDGVNFTANINGGNASFGIVLDATVSGKVYYLGDDKFDAAEAKEFTAVVNDKADSIIAINEPALTIGDSATFTATVNGAAADLIYVVNGVVTDTIAEVEAMNYTVMVIFAGNATHESNYTEKTFTVTKGDVEITVEGTPAKKGEISTITVNITDEATGIVLINVGGTQYSLNISEAKNLEVRMSNVGNIPLTAKYLGDEKFNAKEAASSTIEVTDKITPTIEIQAETYVSRYNQTVINITTDGYGLIVEINEMVIPQSNITRVGNKYSVTFVPNAAGAYTIIATTSENDTYYAIGAMDSFVAIANETTQVAPSIAISDIGTQKIGEEFEFIVGADQGVNLTVKVNGEKISCFDKTGTTYKYKYTPLKAGTFAVTAEVEESELYLAGSTSKTFDVIKNDMATITVNVTDAKVGEKATISVNVTEDATGIVIINVNGTEYSIDLVKTNSLSVAFDKAGEYPVIATYLGDDKYINSTSNPEVIVVSDKLPANIKVEIPDDVKVGDKIIINVSADTGAEVLVYINGEVQTFLLQTGPLGVSLMDVLKASNNKVAYEVSKAGIYNVTVIASENEDYASEVVTKVFEVTKKDAVLEIVPIIGAQVNDVITISVVNETDGEITVKVNGVKVIEDYKILKAGSYTITAESASTDSYNVGFATYTFEVPELVVVKNNTSIALDVELDEYNATFTVSVDENVTGLVKFVMTGTEEYVLYVDIVGGKAVLDDVLTPGDYTLYVTYMGNDAYNTNITFKDFTVLGHVKQDTPIDASVDVNGYSVTITVNVNENATGFVASKIGDTVVNIALTGGAGSVIINLPAGSYNVDLTYLGDYNFNENSAKLEFTVVNPIKENTTISLDVSVVDDNALFTVNVNPNATGLVKFVVSGAEQYTLYVDVVEGKAFLHETFDTGNYTVVVNYMGDDRFNSNITSGTFTVLGHVKQDTPISASADVNGYRVTITVNVNKTATGFVTMKVGDDTVVIPLTNGTGSFSANYGVGSYNVDLTYLGDDNFNESTTKLEFTVADSIKENTPISLDVVAGENNAVLTVNVNDKATGIVKFDVSGADEFKVYVDVIGGKAVIDALFAAGDYNVIATYMGDDRFNSNITSESFTIKGHVKQDTPISASADVSGNRVTINVKVNETATGFVAVKLGDSVVYIALTDGAGSYTTNLAAGSYHADVTYLGDDNFNENSTKLLFTVVDVAKESTLITISIGGFEDNVTFTVNVDSNATGLVKLEVTGTEHYVLYVDVVDGEGYLYGILEPGDYTVTATYLGDGRFNSNITSEVFTVLGHVKQDTSIGASADVNGYRVTIKVNVNETATGFVSMKLGSDILIIPLTDGAGSFTTSFAAGSYNVDLTYLGDDNFNANSTKLAVTVVDAAKENTTIGIDVGGFEDNVTFTVNVDSNATGLVKLEVTGTEHYVLYVDVVDGEGYLYDILEPGDYTVTATYLGDDRFNSNITSKEFTVLGHVKQDTPIAASVDINGYRITITVNVNSNATGFVKIKLGETITNIELVDGTGSLATTMPAGSYHADVTYLGDYNFNENSTKLMFTVVSPVKENTQISLDVSTVNDNVSFTVNVNPNATGLVKFDVSGAEYYTLYVDVIEGVSFLYDTLESGNYSVVVTYMGDSRYNTNMTSAVFAVKDSAKQDTNVSINVPSDINPGENIPIVVDIPGATGNVSVIVDGDESVIPLDENGTAKYTIPSIAVGNHSVVVIYVGDETHTPVHSSSAFSVPEEVVPPKEQTNATISIPSDIKPGDNVTVEVTIANATGNVSVIVDGNEIVVPLVNGSTSVPLDDLASGNHSVVVIYPGDDVHSPAHSASAFNVPVVPVVVKDATEFTDIVVSSDKITAVLKDSQGKQVSGAEISYTIGDVSNTTLTDENGTFTISIVSKSIVTISYAGNDSLLATNTSIVVDNVETRLASEFNVTEGISIKTYAVDTKAGEIGQTTTFRLTDSNGNPIANATVKFAYKTVILERSTDENGIVFLGINTQFAQEALCALSYVGDEKYNATFVAFSFDIQKKPITITANAKTFKSTVKTKKYTVALKTEKCNSRDGKVYLGAGKKVTLKINGKTYTAKTNSNGQATFKITKLTKKSKFIAVVKFAGDKTYESASKKVKITVK